MNNIFRPVYDASTMATLPRASALQAKSVALIGPEVEAPLLRSPVVVASSRRAQRWRLEATTTRHDKIDRALVAVVPLVGPEEGGPLVAFFSAISRGSRTDSPVRQADGGLSLLARSF